MALKMKVSIIVSFIVCFFAAPRLKLVSSAAHIIGDRWNSMSEMQIVRLF